MTYWAWTLTLTARSAWTPKETKGSPKILSQAWTQHKVFPRWKNQTLPGSYSTKMTCSKTSSLAICNSSSSQRVRTVEGFSLSHRVKHRLFSVKASPKDMVDYPTSLVTCFHQTTSVWRRVRQISRSARTIMEVAPLLDISPATHEGPAQSQCRAFPVINSSTIKNPFSSGIFSISQTTPTCSRQALWRWSKN